jgi:hypothetical protein
MKKLIAAVCALAIFAPAAFAASPFVASHFVKLAPSTAKAGKTVRVYGSVGTGCGKTDSVIVFSSAFKGATTHEFAGVPALLLKQDKHHNFSAKVTIGKTIKARSYHVGGRCGGGNFGSATLKVTTN